MTTVAWAGIGEVGLWRLGEARSRVGHATQSGSTRWVRARQARSTNVATRSREENGGLRRERGHAMKNEKEKKKRKRIKYSYLCEHYNKIVFFFFNL